MEVNKDFKNLEYSPEAAAGMKLRGSLHTPGNASANQIAQ